MSSACDSELHTAELTHTDSTVWEPGRSQMTQGDPLTLFTTILAGRKKGRKEEGEGGRKKWEGRREEGRKGGGEEDR